MISFLCIIAISFFSCENSVNTSGEQKEMDDSIKQFVSEKSVWIVGAEIRNCRTWYDGNDQILHLDPDNVSQPLDERVHVGAKVILIDITGVIFYEGTIADVMDEYTAELNMDAPNLSDGEIDGYILVYE